MKFSNDLLLDIIYKKKKNNQLYIQELNDSLNESEGSCDILYKHDIKLKEEELQFLDEIKESVSITSNGLKYLKDFVKKYPSKEEFVFIRFSKCAIVKEILLEYKKEYRKNYWNNKCVGTSGIFDNKLFCDVIKNKIYKYTNCNRVTRKKYNHLVAFLNEFLHEMENSSDPLKTLKQKIKLYNKYKKTEVIEIRIEKISKIDLVKDILKEYNNKKISVR